jgi:integrase
MPTSPLTSKRVQETICPPNARKIEITDHLCKGLFVEIRSTGGKTYYLRYTDDHGKHKQYRLGDALALPLAKARQKAQTLKARISMGFDPAQEDAQKRATPTLEAFADDRYMPFVKGYKRSWISDLSYLRNHLFPAFGKKTMDSITQQDVIAFHHGMKARSYAEGTCNRCLILLRYMFNLAIRWEIPGITINPTQKVALFQNKEGKRERYLSNEETHRLHEALLQSENPLLVHIIGLLLLTGARKREVLDAQWVDFDFDRRLWRIPKTKTGKPRHVPLSDGVITLLAQIPKSTDSPWVFPNPKTKKPFISIFYAWNHARHRAGLQNVRIHDLRHSFASFLVNAGRSLYEVQALLGHTQVHTTQRYAHLSQETLLTATNIVGQSLENALGLNK